MGEPVAPKKDNSPISQNMRGKIAMMITKWVPIATGVLGAIAVIIMGLFIWKEQYKEAKDLLQYIFTAFLPLWGTWIGTVLAFYFSKENFEAASASMQKVVEHLSPQEKLESLKVKDVMIPFDQLKMTNLDSTQQPDDLKVMDIRNSIDAAGKKRWPIFLDGVYKYIFHRSTLDHFISDQTLAGRNPQDLAALTIKDMKTGGSDWVKKVLTNAAAFVAEDATLYDAKKAMDSHDTCVDVFVTPKGKSEGKVLGWISNVDIAENATY